MIIVFYCGYYDLLNSDNDVLIKNNRYGIFK